MSVDLKESAISRLSTTTVTFASTGQTTLYTVPSGKSCIITSCVIIAGADAVTTDITIGVTASWDNWLGANGLAGADFQLDQLDAAGEYCVIGPETDTDPLGAAKVLTRYTAGEVIKIDVVVGTGGAGNIVILFGMLY